MEWRRSEKWKVQAGGYAERVDWCKVDFSAGKPELARDLQAPARRRPQSVGNQRPFSVQKRYPHPNDYSGISVMPFQTIYLQQILEQATAGRVPFGFSANLR